MLIKSNPSSPHLLAAQLTAPENVAWLMHFVISGVSLTIVLAVIMMISEEKKKRSREDRFWRLHLRLIDFVIVPISVCFPSWILVLVSLSCLFIDVSFSLMVFLFLFVLSLQCVYAAEFLLLSSWSGCRHCHVATHPHAPTTTASIAPGRTDHCSFFFCFASIVGFRFAFLS